jgi:protein involved in polysaccharide export with SLBB domain
MQLREAVLLLFCDPAPAECARLSNLPRKEWQELLRWLDTSGLALYFLDRLEDLDRLDTLPSEVLARLRENLADNSERMGEMIAESLAIQCRFQEARLPYAVLKGFSLWPVSVPKLELRSQLDLDFLVAEKGATEARKVLEGFGYRLNAISGKSWEFKASEDRPQNLDSMYKKGLSRSIELHIETACHQSRSLLSGTQLRCIHDLIMPVLSPIDLFLWQGLHLFKHVCSEFSRAAHLIEFRRHVIARYDDDAFWWRLQQQVSTKPEACWKLGVVILLITRLMGRFAPEKLTSWSVDRLPTAVRCWVDIYGPRTVLASFPGTKFYLLLQQEMEAAGLPVKRPLRSALLPRCLPPAITRAVAGEGILARAKRYGRESRFILFRLRFHFFEGISYLRESILWRQRRNGVSATIASPGSRLRALRRAGLQIALSACVLSLSLQAQTPQSAATATDQSSAPSQLPVDLNDANQPANGMAAGAADSGASLGSGSNTGIGTGGGNGTLQSLGAPASLTTDQIFAILQAQPDALVELKSLMSDLAQQQGTSIQADSISDEMLYSRIASSPELRANITIFLRARGYVSDADLQSYAAGGYEDNGFAPAQMSQTTGSMSQGAGLPLNPLLNGAYPGANAGTYGQNYGAIVGANGFGAARGNTARTPASDQPSNTSNSTTSEPQVLHRPAPYNLRSLHDLYTQIPEQSGQLKRFGSDVFLHRNAFTANQIAPNGRETPLDVPAGPGYVVGPGDSLSIALWGGTSQSFMRVIDREGRLALPESGAAQVAGLTLERVQSVVADALKQQYRNVQVAVTVAHLRSIRVYVVGDVQRPGAYDISSLSSSLNALYAAGGPTSTGSLRMLRHYRGKQLVGEIDLYDFLLHGVQNEDRLEAGDTVLAPPAGPQVAVYGAVKRPAIYELKGKATLAALFEDAGGVTVAAELSHIEIDRIDANKGRETVNLDLPASSSPDSAQAAIAAFPVYDGDRVRVSPILPYSQRVIYMQGHVVRPGSVSYRDGMRLSDVLHSYRDLLPEPADKGEIVRLTPPDLHPETIEFNVPDAMIGNNNLALQPFDTIRIYGRYEADAPKVTVGGEVLRPGTYPLAAGMTAAQLVRMAGGLKRDALLENADLTSYRIVGESSVVSERTSVRVGDAVIRPESGADVVLKPGDVLTVHQIAGWNDIGASITIEGEVAHPGNYGIQQGEHLSSILLRAGGLRDTSYPAGAVLLRDEVRALEEKSREELIRQIETSSMAARIGPRLGAGDESATLQLIEQQQQQVLARLKSEPASGRLVIHIDSDIASWENTPADIEVRAGDVLRIPKRPGFVLVDGQVYNSSAITFAPGKTAGWYLRRAGGTTEIANTRDIFIIRANGSVVGRGSGSWLEHDVLATRLEPGDVVVVPQKIIGASVFWRNLLTVAQITSSIAITAAVAGLL